MVICATHWTLAEAEDDRAESRGLRNESIRTIYDRSAALLDGMAFNLAAQNLVTFADSDPESANAWILQEMGLDQAASEQLLALFRQTLENIEADKQKRIEEIACLTGVPRVYGDETYTALEQMDDESEAISQIHYLRVVDQVGQNTAERLQSWLNEQKLTAVYIKSDQRKRSEQLGIDGYQRLERICRQFYDAEAYGARP